MSLHKKQRIIFHTDLYEVKSVCRPIKSLTSAYALSRNRDIDSSANDMTIRYTRCYVLPWNLCYTRRGQP